MKKNRKIKDFLAEKNNSKFMFTPGTASITEENIKGLGPCFGRGDDEYLNTEDRVLKKLKKITGHKNIVRMQGSGSFALEVLSLNFLYGKVLIVSTGHYSDRLYNLCTSAKKNFRKIMKVSKVDWKNIEDFSGRFDWVFACPTETSCGLRIPIQDLKKLSKKIKSKLALDATASIGLEMNHDLADVISYSSCKGLFGLTGGCFIAYNSNPENKVNSFNLDINSHIQKKMTGPYHAIQSLEKILYNHSFYKHSVQINKTSFLKKFENKLIYEKKNQPLLCTYAKCKLGAKDKRVIFYKARNNLSGSVVCHLGEVSLGRKAKADILKKIYVKKEI
tara:strand:- start:459 stop:1457 length:999 start_codon:yes stop_codon:yes gene_type:complete